MKKTSGQMVKYSKYLRKNWWKFYIISFKIQKKIQNRKQDQHYPNMRTRQR